MPSEAPKQTIKDRKIGPKTVAFLSSLMVIFTACTGPVKDALYRLEAARNTTFKKVDSCPTLEGPSNGLIFFKNPTTSYNFSGGLTFSTAYSNGPYTICKMSNASNYYLVQPDGSVVSTLTMSKTLSLMNGSNEIFSFDGNVYNQIRDVNDEFSGILGYFSSASRSNQQVNPTVPQNVIKPLVDNKSDPIVVAKNEKPTEGLSENQIIAYSVMAAGVLIGLLSIRYVINFQNKVNAKYGISQNKVPEEPIKPKKKISKPLPIQKNRPIPQQRRWPPFN